MYIINLHISCFFRSTGYMACVTYVPLKDHRTVNGAQSLKSLATGGPTILRKFVIWLVGMFIGLNNTGCQMCSHYTAETWRPREPFGSLREKLGLELFQPLEEEMARESVQVGGITLLLCCSVNFPGLWQCKGTKGSADRAKNQHPGSEGPQDLADGR